MPKQSLDITDPQAIKAIAHPARYRVVEELYSGRTLTATEAGELCGLSGSAMSYHLRTLARYGLVVQQESVDGRERPWRAAASELNIRGVGKVGKGAAVARSILSNVIDSIQQMAAASTDPEHGFSVHVNHGKLRLTDEQANELDRRIGELVREFEQKQEQGRDRPDEPDAPPLREYVWIRGDDPAR